MEVVDGGGGGGGGGERLLRLRCSVNNYDWGRFGSESGVARLYSLNSGGLIDENRPYAEFWMGTHDSGPSFLVVDHSVAVQNGGGTPANVTLKSWIAKNPKVLGDKVVEKWGNNLPFLFKVLSVAKALSIQAHPDKKLAEVLHELEPNVYKDDNHKPEMVLALTNFEALCGFISSKELKGVLQDVPEIEEVVGTAYATQVLLVDELDNEEKVKAVLRSLFTQLMAASKEVVSYVLSKLISRLSRESKSRQLSVKEELALRLEKQYPDDVGVIAAFLFNYVKLNPGEALFLGANELHAYLSGECIECMATSDNVVRAGLTPKNRDVKILTSMLTYKQGYPKILQGDFLNPHTKRYTPPFEEFEVDSCILDQGETVDFQAFPGPSIYVVILGHGAIHTSTSKEEVWEGDVFFAPAGTAITVSTESMLHLCRAGVNSSFFRG